MLKELPKEQSELIKDIVPSLITISGIQRVLQILLAERVSIRDLSTFLEGIADGLASTRNPMMLAEHVRGRLSRQLCAQHTSPAGYLPIIALTARWEQAFAESIVGQGDDRNLAMQPSKLTEFINLVREKFELAARDGEAPVLVTSAHPAIRTRDRRTLPRTNERAGAIGDPPARAAEDRGQHLIIWPSPARLFVFRRQFVRSAPSPLSGSPRRRSTVFGTGHHGRSRFGDEAFPRAEWLRKSPLMCA